MSTLNERATAALEALEKAGRIRDAWIPGMMTTFEDDEVIGATGPFLRRLDGEERLYKESRRHLEGSNEEREGDGPVLVDLSDPLTVQACLLLAREAWKRPLYAMPEDSLAELWSLEGIPDPGYGEFNGSICGASEAEVVVQALERAVEWSGLQNQK
jgi:hypothetical protein